MNEARALVIKATDGNAKLADRQEAFARLVQSFQDMAYACAYAVLGDFQLAEDAAQEAFISAWQKLHQLRQPEAFPGWFKRILLTQCNRLMRGKRLLAASLDDGKSIASTRDNPQEVIERDDLRKTVLAAIEKLPESERMVVVLFYLKEYSQRDISAFLEVPTTTIAKRLYTARARLRGRMTKDFREIFMAHCPSRNRSFAEKVRDGIFDEYIGEYRYESRPELTVTIKRKGDKLISESAGQTNELLAEEGSETELLAKEFDGRGRFIRDRKGRISHFIYYEFGQEMGRAMKIG